MNQESFNLSRPNDRCQPNVNDAHSSASAGDEISIYDVFSERQHRIILFWLSAIVILMPFSDTMYLPAIHTIAINLKTTDTLVNFTISLYLLSVGISNLIWGVLSDRWGRKIIMKIGLSLFLLTVILCIFAQNIYVLLLLRIIQGGTVSVTGGVVQGTIADIYASNRRGWATGISFIPILLGVVAGPTLGGTLTYYFGWRSTFVFLSIFTTCVLVIYIAIIPETHQYKVMQQQTDKKIIERNEIVEPKLQSPLASLKYLRHSSIIPYICSASTAFASILVNQCLLAITLAQEPYNFNQMQIGLSSIPLACGEIVGCLLGGYLTDNAMHIFKDERLETRLVPGMIVFPLIPIGLAVFGWTFQFKLHASIPIISGFVVAFAHSVYRPAVYSYSTIREQQNAATVSSINSCSDFILASICVSISLPFINRFNIGSFFTILSLMNIIAIVITIVVTIRKPSIPFDYQSI